MPVTAGAEELAGAVTRALRPDVALVGFDADAVGIAVRRALGRATSWADHTFDVIPPRTMHPAIDRKSTRLNSSHVAISYAVFCLKKKTRTPRSHAARST